jgi:hypothetical protein
MNSHRPTSAAPATVDRVAARGSRLEPGRSCSPHGDRKMALDGSDELLFGHQAVRMQRGSLITHSCAS